MIGNKAAHGQHIESQIAIDLLADLNDLTAWFIHFMPSHSFIRCRYCTKKPIRHNGCCSFSDELLQIKTAEIQQLHALAQPQLRSKHHLQLLDSFAEYDLTDDQQHLVKQLDQFLALKSTGIFIKRLCRYR
jgi:hypothetical protein